jgi:hypothetical protein
MIDPHTRHGDISQVRQDGKRLQTSKAATQRVADSGHDGQEEEK